MMESADGRYCENCGRKLSETESQLALVDSTDIYEGSFKRFCSHFCLLMHTLREMHVTSFEFTQGDAKISCNKPNIIDTLGEAQRALTKIYRSQF